MSYKLSEKLKKTAMEKVFIEIERRGHVFIQGDYEQRTSALQVFCPIHHRIWKTPFYNYNRSVNGCKNCGQDIVSGKLKNRQFTQKTLNKMSLAHKKRPNRGGKPRHWRKNAAYRNYRKYVLTSYEETCAISGLKPKGKNQFLIVHHLISAHLWSDLAYEPKNGIVLAPVLHLLFHKLYGYKKNSICQMKSFLLFTR